MLDDKRRLYACFHAARQYLRSQAGAWSRWLLRRGATGLNAEVMESLAEILGTWKDGEGEEPPPKPHYEIAYDFRESPEE